MAPKEAPGPVHGGGGGGSAQGQPLGLIRTLGREGPFPEHLRGHTPQPEQAILGL